MNIFVSKNRVFNPLSIPISCLAAITIALSVLSYVISIDSALVISLTYSAVCSGFVALYYINDSKGAMCLVCGVVMLDALYYALCSQPIGIGALTLYIAVLVLALRHCDSLVTFAVSLAAGIALALLLWLLRAPCESLLRLLATALSTRPTLFGVVNNAYTAFLGNGLSELIYHKSIGASYFINGELCSGVVDCFLANPKGMTVKASAFLTGQYFVNIFLPIGAFVALYSRLRDNYILPLILTTLLSVLFGSNALFSVFIFFYNPFIYIGYLAASALCYLIPKLMGLAIGFEHSASLIELFRFGNGVIWLAAVGAVLSVLMYFICNLVLSRHDFASGRYFPREVRALVDALGGERNILNIENARLYVANPNLIDILRVDCDIRGNEITLMKDDFELLLEYF